MPTPSVLTERDFASGPVLIHYAERPGVPGARPSVLLHGSTLSWQTFLSLIHHLGPAWHAYALDLRGHGRSGRAPGRYRLLDYAADVRAFLQEVVRRPAVLLGHSLGALAAIPVAAELPEAVQGLVLLDPPLLYRDTRLLDSKWARDFTGSYEVLTQAETEEARAALLARQQPGADPAALRSRARRLGRVDPGTLRVLLEHQHLEGYDFDSLLRRIEPPTLIIQCDLARDAALEDDDAEFARARLRHARFVRLDGAGHMVHSEQPERVAQLLENFAAELK